MEARASGILVAAAACLLLLGGCESSTRLGDPNPEASQGVASELEPAVTGSVRQPPADTKPESVAKGSPGKSENELALGKKYFGAGKFAAGTRISAPRSSCWKRSKRSASITGARSIQTGSSHEHSRAFTIPRLR